MKMDIQKLNPWNWFKHENEESGKPVTVEKKGHRPGVAQSRGLAETGTLWDIHREIDHLFENAFSGLLPAGRGLNKTSLFLKPEVDIREEKDKYEISVEIPGVNEDDIKLELSGGLLTVSGEKKQEKEDKDEHYHSIERSYGAFRRVLNLPEDVDEDAIDARFENGVLTIAIPRKEVAKDQGGKVIDINRAA